MPDFVTMTCDPTSTRTDEPSDNQTTDRDGDTQKSIAYARGRLNRAISNLDSIEGEDAVEQAKERATEDDTVCHPEMAGRLEAEAEHAGKQAEKAVEAIEEAISILNSMEVDR